MTPLALHPVELQRACIETPLLLLGVGLEDDNLALLALAFAQAAAVLDPLAFDADVGTDVPIGRLMVLRARHPEVEFLTPSLRDLASRNRGLLGLPEFQPFTRIFWEVTYGASHDLSPF